MILAIETATEVCSTAVIDRGAVISVRSQHEKNIHSERLLSMIDEVLSDAAVVRTSLSAIAVSVGPGSFTGLRIGLSAAKGLVLALDIPLIAVPTLDGIAESYRLSQKGNASEKFCSMIDAKREEAFFAFYAVAQNEITRESEYSITLKKEILSDAAQRSAEVVQPEISAASIGLLAERKKDEFIIQDFSTIEPLYLRDFVATLPKNKI